MPLAVHHGPCALQSGTQNTQQVRHDNPALKFVPGILSAATGAGVGGCVHCVG